MLFSSRSITIFVFFISMLQTAGALYGDPGLYFTFRDGDEATLPCKNVIQHHQNCATTTWLFTDQRGTETVELVSLGKLKEHDKLHRLSVTVDCSLVIKNITAEDVGLYTCRQYNSGSKQGPDALVHLSVVSLTEHKNSDEVTLSCSVSPHTQCTQGKVEWVYNSKHPHLDRKMSQSVCSATVTFLALKYGDISRDDFKCNVTTGGSKVQLFAFSPRSSGEDTKTTITTAKTSSTNTLERTTKNSIKESETQGGSKGLLWLYMLAPVVLLALLIIVVTVISSKRLKGNKKEGNGNVGLPFNSAPTQSVAETSQEMEDPEDGISYASVSYAKKANRKDKVWVKNDKDKGEEVIYSAVKASSADPSSLYAAIK